jgi:hypothetical protein
MARPTREIHKPLESAGESTHPPKPSDWRSTVELSRIYLGGNKEIARALLNLRSRLIGDLVMELECRSSEAEALIDDHLVGRRKPARGRSGWCVSPDGERLLKLLPRTMLCPAKPDKWLSVRQIKSLYVGSFIRIESELKALRDGLISDIVLTGVDVDKAERMVEAHLIGYRKPRHGPEALAASPEVIRIAVEEGWLVPRTEIGHSGCKR